MSTGCIATTPFTVNPLPAAIAGIPTVCQGLVTVLSDATAGGTWTSSSSSVAPVVAGVVTGLSVGTSTITYQLPTGCNTIRLVRVNPLPSAISGTTTVCQGLTSALTDPGSGNWTTSNSAIAAVGLASGVVTGIAPGTATITYTLPTTCIATASVLVRPAPAKYTVSGGGNYCSGGLGNTVDLGNSDLGFSYQLYNSTTTVGTPIAGTGSPFSFGLQTAGGNYTVVSTNNTTGCTVTMLSSATIVVNPLPIIYRVSGGGNYCSGGTGVHVGLAGSETGINYALYKNGIIFDGPLPGTTGPLDFGLETNAGTYKITGTNTTTGCVSKMSDSAIVVVDPLLTPYVSISPAVADSICVGELDTFTVTVANQGTAPVFQWSVNGVDTGGNTRSFIYTPSRGDVVLVTMTSNANCLVPNHTALDEITVIADTNKIPVVDIMVVPGIAITKGKTDTFKATVFNGGSAPKYQWFINNKPVNGATKAVFYTDSLANQDSVSCLVTGSGKCSQVSFNGVQVLVSSTGVQNLNSHSEIIVNPNPNNGFFTVKGTLASTDDQEVTLELANMVGQVIYKEKVHTHGGVINHDVHVTNTVASGTYLLNVHSGAENKVFHVVIGQ